MTEGPGVDVDALLGRCQFPPPGTSLVCAVSGGADSLALLVLATAAGCEVTAVHVDHGLRPGSAAEADVVAAAASGLGAGFRAERVHVEPGPNLEERARQARWAAVGPDAATGHTADDQAETLVLNLLRGAGLAGMAAMRPGWRHPILALRRAETEAVCAARGLGFVRDPSNDDPSYRRNRVRHEVLPLLAAVADRDVVPLLARSAAQARSVLGYIEGEARQLVADPTDVAALREAPEVVASAAVHQWLRQCSPHGHPPDGASVARVLAVVRGDQRATEVAGGWRVVRRQGRLELESPGSR
jgi:tRNA(Ile)-lysidine synthase